MARETKVGLLAGLTFIVVFAAILANRGQKDPLLSQKSLSTDSQVAVGEKFVPTDPYEVRNTLRELPEERYRPTPVRMQEPFGAGDSIAAERVSGEQDPPRKTPPGTRTIRFGPAAESPQSAIAVARPIPQETTTSPPGLSKETQQFASQGTRQIPGDPTSMKRSGVEAQGLAGGDAVAAPLATVPQKMVTVPLILQQQVSSELKKSAVAGAKYVVLAGDTLYAIAGKHYGKRGGKFVRAIVEANRDTLPDPNKLRVGVVLVLPKMDVKAKVAASSVNAPAGGGSGATTATKTTANKLREFEWYQVRKGDRYASIAREKLGDARRWRELFEMNKDKFPNPDRIRDGVLIKIPKSREGEQG